MMHVDLHLLERRLSGVAVDAPVDSERAPVKDEFEEQLSKVVEDVRAKEDVLHGDFDARVGRRVDDPVVGIYGEDTVNDNGKRLIGICEEFELGFKTSFKRG